MLILGIDGYSASLASAGTRTTGIDVVTPTTTTGVKSPASALMDGTDSGKGRKISIGVGLRIGISLIPLWWDWGCKIRNAFGTVGGNRDADP